MFQNLHYKLLALGLAIVFWIFVVSLKSSVFEFPQLVPLQVFNLGEKLAIFEMPKGIKITLRSEGADVFRTLQASDFDAYIDLSDIGVGERKIPVTVNSKNPKVEIIRIEPKEAFIKIEPIREKALPVHVEIQGKPANGFEIGDAKTDVNAVKISGAENMLSNVNLISASVILDGTENKAFSKKVSLKAVDVMGQAVSGITISPSEITVSVDLLEKEKEKQVGVKVDAKGSSAAGFVKSITVEPSVLTIIGESSVVEGVSFVETEPLNLAQFTASMEKKMKLSMPSGIKIKGGDFVTVKIEIEKLGFLE